MVHRCHGAARTSVRGFRYNRGKKEIYYAQVLFIYFEQTIVHIKMYST